MKIIASARHAEYGPAEIEGLTVTIIWPPVTGDQETDDNILDSLWDWSEGDLKEHFQETTGEAAPGNETGNDWDLAWEHIVKWEGDVVAIKRGLESLLADIDVLPGGDDDSYDYWPSGVLYAQQIIEALSKVTDVRAQQALLDTICKNVFTLKEHLGPELADRLGYDNEEQEDNE